MKYRHILLALALLPAALPAQDLRQLEPEPLPPLAPPAQPQPQPPAPTVPAAGPVLPDLKGLVFLSRPEQLGTPTQLDQNRLDTRRVPFLDSDEFARHMAAWWDQPVTERRVRDLLAAVNAYYAERDRPFVSVTAPNQDISAGILRVLVVEGRLSDVQVRGNQWFDDAHYLRALNLPMDEPIRISELRSGLDWIARSNPFHAANALAMPGETFGATALQLQTTERRPLRLYGGVNNTGTDTTGTERVILGANWGRAFGTDHQLNTQLSASPDFHKSLGLSANYRIPLQSWRHVVQLSAAWSRINADVPANFDSEGESWQLITRYELPVLIGEHVKHYLRVGLEHKRSDNNLEFGGIPVTDNVTDIMQLALDWRIAQTDRFGRTSLNTRLVYSPGDLSSRNDDEAFDASRWGASADYGYARLDLQRHTPLPARFAWNAMATVQQSSDNLLGSEQLGLGGSAAVRGFRENALYADEGFLLRNELALPPMSLLRGDDDGAPDHLRFHVFYDYGRGNSVDRLPGELHHLGIDAVGVGARYRLGDNLSASLEYAWQHRGIPGQSRNRQAHFNLLLSY